MEKAQIEALNNLLKREVLTEDEKKALRALMDGEIHTATINKIAFDRKSAPEENARFCLDFGTAFSKAWATGRDVGETLPLVLGEIAGDEGLIVPSSIYIAKNGRVYIGREAETQHRADVRPGRVRFDNLKRMLTEAEIRTELRAIPLREGIDPTGSGLTGGDLLVVYLAWLTDLAEDALSNAIRATDGRFSLGEFDPRGVKRRFALPCFEESANEIAPNRLSWARETMEDALLRAQVVADTLHGKWSTLDSHSLAHLMKDIHKLDVARLRHLLCESPAIREPIAAGASRFDAAIERLDEPAKRPIRHYLLVVDAGAGTTDFAFFQAITPTGQMDPKYALLRGSIRMCRIAGNEIDKILRPIILNACGVDRLKYGAEDIAYAEIDLDSRIREIKRDLFTRKQLPITLRPNFNGDIKLDDLLSDSTMSYDGRELLELRMSIIASLFPPDVLATLRANAMGGVITIHVLITGGSATVPIILELGRGSTDLDGVTFRFTPVQNLPEWIDQLPRDAAQTLANVYPQSAVAIGGSTPALPEELGDLNAPITPTKPGPPLAQGVRMSGTRI